MALTSFSGTETLKRLNFNLISTTAKMKKKTYSPCVHLCIVLYCIELYCTVLYCIVLYCIELYCIVLY